MEGCPFRGIRYFGLDLKAGSTFLLLLGFTFFFACKGNVEYKSETKKVAPKEKPIVLPSQQAAIDRLNDSIAANPKSDSLYFVRAKHYLESDNIEDGFYDLYKAIQLNPKVKDYYLTGSLYFIGDQDLRSAMGLVEDGLKQLPNNADLHLEMAKMNLYIRKYDKTEDHLAKALVIDPNLKEAYLYGAISSKEQDKMNLAIQSLQRAIEIDPDFYEGLFMLGEYHKRTDPKLAVQYYQNALRVDPQSIETLYAIGLMHQEMKDYKTAIKTYKDILKMDNQFEDAYYNIGYIYLQQDSLELGRKNFELAIRVSPSCARCYYMRGHASELNGDLEGAKRDFEQALVLDGELENAKKGLKRIRQN